MNQEFPADEVLIEVENGVAVMTLNRSKVLNALSLEMIRTIASALHRWRNDDSVKAVVFKGEGGKAFSAGGDIKSFYHAGMDYRRGTVSERVPLLFFAEEYSLNKQLFHYPKPTVAIMNGITMGGGYGIAGNCKHRVACENTVFAMPEVGIGFFADVGSMYHLQKCPHNWGRYLALTGNRLSGSEMTALGLADIYVGNEDVENIVQSIIVQGEVAEDTLLGLHRDFEVNAPDHDALIDTAFEDLDVLTILDNLEKDGSAFALDTESLIRKRSPSSVSVMAFYLKRSASFDFDDVIAMDFVLVQHFIQKGDLYEGVRAVLLDKDNTPHWDPALLENIEPEAVKTYFTPTGYDLSDVQIFET